jgi:uncharacterized protein (DUF934 family)
MPLLKAPGFAADDWTPIVADDPLPTCGDVAVSWARLTRDWDMLVKHDGRLGVTFPNNQKVAALDLYLSRLGLIILDFPVFNDGRSFSIARQLRRDGFAGEIRASGHVMPDLLQFMLQVGFDSFQVSDRFKPELWLQSLKRMSVTYQHGLEDRKTVYGAAAVWKARHGFSPLSDDERKAG